MKVPALQLIVSDSDGFAVMVYFSILVIPKSVHVCVNQNYNEGVEEVEQQPYIHHLHVGGLGKIVAHIDEHRSQHQHWGQVYGDNSLKNKLLLTQN